MPIVLGVDVFGKMRTGCFYLSGGDMFMERE